MKNKNKTQMNQYMETFKSISLKNFRDSTAKSTLTTSQDMKPSQIFKKQV